MMFYNRLVKSDKDLPARVEASAFDDGEVRQRVQGPWLALPPLVAAQCPLGSNTEFIFPDRPMVTLRDNSGHKQPRRAAGRNRPKELRDTRDLIDETQSNGVLRSVLQLRTTTVEGQDVSTTLALN